MDKVIQHNSYYCHLENLLLGMITDDSRVIRELGLRRILKARESGNKSLRKFVLPKIRMEVSNFHSMIDWQRCNRSGPPLTMDVRSECLQLLVTTGDKITALPDLPNHTQVVERMIKLVTATSVEVVGLKERDRLICSRIEGRKRLPKFNTKKDFHSMLQH